LLVLICIQPSDNSITVDEQYGFRLANLTINLIVFNNLILEAFKKTNQLNIHFKNCSKAFDRVDHKILMEVLYKTGFEETILS